MNTWREWCRKNGVKLTPLQVMSMTYLEAMGKRFLVDFGYENCQEEAVRCMTERDAEFIDVVVMMMRDMKSEGGVM